MNVMMKILSLGLISTTIEAWWPRQGTFELVGYKLDELLSLKTLNTKPLLAIALNVLRVFEWCSSGDYILTQTLPSIHFIKSGTRPGLLKLN